MADICPTVTAYDLTEFQAQLDRIKPFAQRIHIDLMDGDLAPTKSPDVSEISLPAGIICDIHLMYRRPMEQLTRLVALKPNMVIVHAEAELDHQQFVAGLHQAGVQAGLALLQSTTVQNAKPFFEFYDHILIFSGDLGHHGGQADLGLLDKVQAVLGDHPALDIGWDGGINDANAAALVKGGVEVLNVGSYIQGAADPKAAYATLKSIVKKA